MKPFFQPSGRLEGHYDKNRCKDTTFFFIMQEKSGNIFVILYSISVSGGMIMEKSNRNLTILAVIMGIIWVSLLFTQITMTKHVFLGYKEAFRAKLDGAVVQSFKTLDRMAFKTFFHGERFKDWYRRMNSENSFEDDVMPMDSSYRFLQNLEGIAVKYAFLSRFVEETHSCFDYRFLGYDVVDSVISKALHDNNIYDPYKIGLYSVEENAFVFMSQGVDANQLLDFGIKYSILCINKDGKILSDGLCLYFPNLQSRYQRDIVTSYVVIILLLLVLLYCFIVFLVIVRRQRKLNEFRVQMLHSITHEIKTPITTISLACQLLQDKSVQKDEHASEEYLSMISEESDSILSMIDEVLTVARSQQMPVSEMEDVHIHSLLTSVVDNFQLRLSQCGAVVNFNLSAEKDVVSGNSTHLSNGFSNLLDNAIKYRNGDLVIDISTENAGDSIVIRFKDNGIGIAKENQQLIFEPFARVNVDNTHYVKGFGLGLNYLLQIINYHKGTIKVESELSKGATFVVSLPLKI